MQLVPEYLCRQLGPLYPWKAKYLAPLCLGVVSNKPKLTQPYLTMLSGAILSLPKPGQTPRPPAGVNPEPYSLSSNQGEVTGYELSRVQLSRDELSRTNERSVILSSTVGLCSRLGLFRGLDFDTGQILLGVYNLQRILKRHWMEPLLVKHKYKKSNGGGGSIIASHPAARGLILGIPRNFYHGAA